MDGYSMDFSGEKEPMVKKLLQQGWREFEIVDCVPETSKSGNDMFVFHMKDVATEYVDRVYAIAVQGKRWMLKSILLSCDVEAGQDGKYKWNFDSVMNKKIMGFVEHEPNEFINRNNETVKTIQHKITKFKKNSEMKDAPIAGEVENPDGVKTPEDIGWQE